MPSTALKRFSKASILQAKGVVSVFHDAECGMLCSCTRRMRFRASRSGFTVSAYQASEPCLAHQPRESR